MMYFYIPLTSTEVQKDICSTIGIQSNARPVCMCMSQKDERGWVVSVCVWVCEKFASLKNHCTSLVYWCYLFDNYLYGIKLLKTKDENFHAFLIKRPSFVNLNCSNWQVGSQCCGRHNYFSLSLSLSQQTQTVSPSHSPAPSSFSQ